MSDLAATNCGCDNRCDCDNSGFFGGNNCSCIIWILILLALCGNGNNWGNNGCGDNSCLIIIILLFCCCGFGNNNDCGCRC